jgi:lipopolysaccharide transport system ATP-binding protein
VSGLVLAATGLGKRYARYASELDRFAGWFGASVTPAHEHWALRDVSFELRTGEAVAAIGPNGAGKSTLLKLITGTVRPTEGTVQVTGRVSAILELGLGFNPEFTGRENVHAAGGLMGFLPAELQARMPEIEAFAELGSYFDQPLRVYSSGMYARLAFALATAFRPDVLIVDEALSVGDSYFQHKSFERIREFREQGTSLLLVSHSMGDVRALCDRVLLLENGRVLRDGRPDEVVDYYAARVAEKENASLSIEQRRRRDGWLQTQYGSREIVVEALSLVDAETGAAVQTARVGQRLAIETTLRADADIARLVIGHRIADRTGHVVWGSNTWHAHQLLEGVRRGQRIRSQAEFQCTLGPGSYAITIALTSTDTHLEDAFDHIENAVVFDVHNADKDYFLGSAWLDVTWRLQATP